MVESVGVGEVQAMQDMKGKIKERRGTHPSKWMIRPVAAKGRGRRR